MKLKKVRKTTRPLRYDLNQIPYDYTVEVRNKFKGLYLIDRVTEKLRTEVPDIVQEAMTKIINRKKKYKKAKRLSEEALQIAEKRREAKGKGNTYPSECRVQKQGEIRKPSSAINPKK